MYVKKCVSADYLLTLFMYKTIRLLNELAKMRNKSSNSEP